MIKKVDHIGVAVKSIDEALKIYRDALGLHVDKVQEQPSDAVKIAFIPVGDSEVELLEPLGPEGPMSKFLESRGEGIHHICLEVDDIDRELANLAEKGVQLIDRQSRQGAVGRVAFIHPRSTRGVLLELVQKTS
jgi:lactoylglutathione lyase/methylmalonyl-CoA/ethylmalonyl-CoA epimerase